VDSDALFLLHRIAAVLGHALDIRLVPGLSAAAVGVSRARGHPASTACDSPAGTAPARAWPTPRWRPGLAVTLPNVLGFCLTGSDHGGICWPRPITAKR
jgi:hypothetical protein